MNIDLTHVHNINMNKYMYINMNIYIDLTHVLSHLEHELYDL